MLTEVETGAVTGFSPLLYTCVMAYLGSLAHGQVVLMLTKYAETCGAGLLYE